MRWWRVMNCTVPTHSTDIKHYYTLLLTRMAVWGRRTTVAWILAGIPVQIMYWMGLIDWTIVGMWGLAGIVEKFYMFLVPDTWNDRAMELWDKCELKVLMWCKSVGKIFVRIMRGLKKIKWKSLGQPGELDPENPFSGEAPEMF